MPTAPNTGTPPQLVVGLTNSLSDDRKAGLTMAAAQKACALYSSATEAQLHLLYALPSIEKDVLKHRLLLIDETSAQLDKLIVANMKIVEAGNLTRPAVYNLQGAKIRLDTSRTAALTGITSPYVPPLSKVPLRELVATKMIDDAAAQTAQAKLAKQSTWDIAFSAGVRRQLDGTNTLGTSATGAYGAVGLTYNLARGSVNRHLDKSVEEYRQWKESQFDDVSSQAKILRQQIDDTITIQSQQLDVLLSHDGDIKKNLQALEGTDTAAAIGFRNELVADELILRVDIKDAEFRIACLQAFLVDNF